MNQVATNLSDKKALYKARNFISRREQEQGICIRQKSRLVIASQFPLGDGRYLSGRLPN